MKRVVVFLSVLLLSLAGLAAQETLRTPPVASADPASGEERAASSVSAGDPAEANVFDPGLESFTWATGQFAAFTRDPDMCDVGTALYEDSLRQQAMREHPEWPIWTIDLALDEARDSYLRAMLFAE